MLNIGSGHTCPWFCLFCQAELHCNCNQLYHHNHLLSSLFCHICCTHAAIGNRFIHFHAEEFCFLPQQYTFISCFWSVCSCFLKWSVIDKFSGNICKFLYTGWVKKQLPYWHAFTNICKLLIVILTTIAQFPVHEGKNEWWNCS